MNLSTMSRTVQLFTRLLDARSATEPFVPVRGEKPLLPLRPAEQPLPRCTPEEEGLSSRQLRQFLEELRAPDLFMHSVMVLRHGRVVCEAAYGAQSLLMPKYTFSACKSVVSLAVGLLVDDGVLNLSETVEDLFGDLVTPVIRRKLKGMTVEDLLTMRAGVIFSEAEALTETEWAKRFLGASVKGEPGKEFHYNSINTYMLSCIVCRKTGGSLTELLQKRLFGPMGITDTIWETCPAGVEKGGWGLYIRPEDMAKLGQLVLDGGLWRGERLISEEYLRAATSAHASPPPELGGYDYGYQIWVGRQERSFLFNGMLGQNVLGFWDSGILVVSNAGDNTSFQQGRYFEIVNRYFGGAFRAGSLPPDREAYRDLSETAAALSNYNRPVSVLPPASPFLNRNFIADDPRAVSAGLLPLALQALYNNYTRGVVSVAVSVRDALPELIYREKDAAYRLRVGLGRPEITPLDFRGNMFQVAAQGRFTHDEEERPVFYVRLDFMETPSTRILKLRLTEEGMLLEQTESPGIPFVYEKLRSAAAQPLARSLLAMSLGSVDEDFLFYRTKLVLSPQLRFVCRG